ncbi:AMP-binding protein, partial [Pantoea sp. SIMBA_072]
MNTSSPELTDCVSALQSIADQYPEKTAIVDGDTSISYKDLQTSIEHRSAVLLAAGLKPGYRVALVAESSAEYLSTA